MKKTDTYLPEGEFEHKYTRRKHGHDYYSPCTYHIILKKHPAAPKFGMLKGDAKIKPGEPGCAEILRSPLGRVIKKEIYDLPLRFPILSMYQYVVMPDHIHILLRIKERSPKHLGYYIGMLTTIIRTECLKRGIIPDNPNYKIFEENYTDKIIHPGRKLDDIYRYIRENPHRLAMRHQYPHFYQRAAGIKIRGVEYEAYGNLFLLRNPFKCQVIVHRADSIEKKNKLRSFWLYNASTGNVLVSPFISSAEKGIRKEAEKIGGGIVLITHEPFGERYKPAEHDFNLCAEGRLLIVAPKIAMGNSLTRDVCLQMNELAKQICFYGID